jgi:hypothetical protein
VHETREHVVEFVHFLADVLNRSAGNHRRSTLQEAGTILVQFVAWESVWSQALRFRVQPRECERITIRLNERAIGMEEVRIRVGRDAVRLA